MMRIPQRLAALCAVAFLCAGVASAQTLSSTQVKQTLAPSGTLLVGVYRGSPTSIIEGPDAARNRGVGYDLGKKLAADLGVPFKAVIYPANDPLLADVQAGKVDIVFTNATAERAKTMAFSSTFMAVEKSFLVPRGSSLHVIEDAAKPGLTIGVSKGSSTSEELKALYPNVKTVEIDTLKHAGQMLASHKIDAFATNDAILYQLSGSVPGSHVLPGHWGMEHFGAGIPKGREAALPYLNDFLKQSAQDGSIARAIKRVNLRGTVAEGGK